MIATTDMVKTSGRNISLAEGNIGLNGKKVLFIWLRGANDSLNSVIPVGDPQYYVNRPSIGIPADAGIDYGGTGPAFDATQYTDATFALRGATATEAQRLGIKPDTELVVIQRLRYADGFPLSVDCAHFPADLVPDLLEQPLGGSIYEILAVRYDLAPASSIESIEVVSANPREAAWLEIPTRTPLLAMTRVASDANGQPFEYSEDLFRADRVRLVAKNIAVAERETLGTDGRVELTVTA